MAYGCYKENYMVLTNQELYFYLDKDQPKYTQMIILTPGVFVKSLSYIPVDPDQGSPHCKVFPIELYVGGQIGNIGKEQVKLCKSNPSGIITLYFGTEDAQALWNKFLEKATGSYKIKDFYNFPESFDKLYNSILTPDKIKNLKQKFKESFATTASTDKVSLSRIQILRLANTDKLDDLLGIGSSGSVIV